MTRPVVAEAAVTAELEKVEGSWQRRRSWASRGLSWATFEVFLKRWPNGGAMIASRSVLSAAVAYCVVIAFKNAVDPAVSWTFDFCALRAQVVETIPWFGAIVGGFYAALYTRFAAQWEYVAGVYHQIKQVECTAAPSNDQALAEWKAAFIEDCDDLHLARKPSFAATIVCWGRQELVRASFASGAPGGAGRLQSILAAASQASGIPVHDSPPS